MSLVDYVDPRNWFTSKELKTLGVEVFRGSTSSTKANE